MYRSSWTARSVVLLLLSWVLIIPPGQHQTLSLAFGAPSAAPSGTTTNNATTSLLSRQSPLSPPARLAWGPSTIVAGATVAASQKVLHPIQARVNTTTNKLAHEIHATNSHAQTSHAQAAIYRGAPSPSPSPPSSASSSLSTAYQHTFESHKPTIQTMHDPPTVTLSSPRANRPARSKRAHQEVNPDCEIQATKKPAIFGLRCDSADVTDDGIIIVRAHEPTKLYLIGRNLYSNLSVALTPSDGSPQDDCTHTDRVKSLQLFSMSLNVAEVTIDLASPGSTTPLYFCLRESVDSSGWFHQGSEPWLRIFVKQDIMPLYMKIITIACLLGLSGLFSGLNLGLMALDKNELQVIMKCGSENEKRYARVIEPVRRRGNYLLCSILFSNTLVNSTISVLLEELSSGLVAIITSTILIVLFGEILPQAFCSRHGLAVGAKTIGLTNFCMIITFPLSYPVSYCLDWALGEEIGHAYDRERLMEFIKVTQDINNLETEEVNIITGALKIKKVQIKEIMTRIEDVYMMDETAVLDFDTIQAIVEKGYSRIPVHEAGNRAKIVAILFAKDLALVDPDDKTPVQTMISFYNHPRVFFYEDATIDVALNEFKKGESHMAIVGRVNDCGDKDPSFEIVGVVTLEDVIEEIMQMEINDETDTLTDNRRKRRRKEAQVRKDFSQFTNLGSGDSSFNVVTPQLCLAAYQYLATTVEPFSTKYLSDSILRRLLSQRIFYKVKADDPDPMKRLYTAGEAADYFIMILEGRVHVICGKENLFFDGGPFSFFGKAALTQDEPRTESITTINPEPVVMSSRRESIVRPIIMSRRESLAIKKLEQQQTVDQTAENLATITTAGTFIPDYTVDVVATTSYLKVTRKDYLTAVRATLVERSGVNTGNDENEPLAIESN